MRRRCDQKQDKTANTHPADWFEMLLPSSISLIPVRDPMAAAIRARSSSVMLERTKSSASTEVSPACSIHQETGYTTARVTWSLVGKGEG